MKADALRMRGGMQMLRGRYGIGWMIIGWLVIIALIAAGIAAVGQLPRLWGQ